MLSVQNPDRHLSLALENWRAACDIMDKKPWIARRLLDGALAAVELSDSPERDKVDITIKADLAVAVSKNEVYVNAFIEQGALGIFERALEQSERTEQERPRAYVLLRRAEIRRNRCQYWEAEDNYKQALEIAERYSSDQGFLLMVLDSYAGTLRKMERWEQAKQLEWRAHEIRESR